MRFLSSPTVSVGAHRNRSSGPRVSLCFRWNLVRCGYISDSSASGSVRTLTTMVSAAMGPEGKERASSARAGVRRRFVPRRHVSSFASFVLRQPGGGTSPRETRRRFELVACAMSRRLRRRGRFLDVWASGHPARASRNELPKATRTDRPRWFRGAASGLYAEAAGARPGCATRPRTTRTRLAYPRMARSSCMWTASGVARAWKCACPWRFSWRVETPPSAAELARRCSRSRSRLPRGPPRHQPQPRRTLARCTPPPPRFCATTPSKTTRAGPPPRRATRRTASGCLLVLTTSSGVICNSRSGT